MSRGGLTMLMKAVRVDPKSDKSKKILGGFNEILENFGKDEHIEAIKSGGRETGVQKHRD